MLIFVTCDVSPFAGFAWFLARAVLNMHVNILVIQKNLVLAESRMLLEYLVGGS